MCRARTTKQQTARKQTMQPTTKARLAQLVGVTLVLLLIAGRPYGVPATPLSAPRAIAAAALGCGGLFAASADSYVNEGAPTVNNGSSTQLSVAKSVRGEMRTLLAFDLGSSVPAGATIHKAELALTLATSPAAEPFLLELREAGAALGE